MVDSEREITGEIQNVSKSMDYIKPIAVGFFILLFGSWFFSKKILGVLFLATKSSGGSSADLPNFIIIVHVLLPMLFGGLSGFITSKLSIYKEYRNVIIAFIFYFIIYALYQSATMERATYFIIWHGIYVLPSVLLGGFIFKFMNRNDHR